MSVARPRKQAFPPLRIFHDDGTDGAVLRRIQDLFDRVALRIDRFRLTVCIEPNDFGAERHTPADHRRDPCQEEPAMTPPTHEPQPGTREYCLQVTILRRWGTIQDYVDPCREPGYFTPAFYAAAIAHLGIM
jgi:hypothetical protein